MSTEGLGADSVVAIAGAGAMGAGIAQVAAERGHPVLLYDARPGAAAAAIAGIGRFYDKLAAKGKMTPAAAAAAAARLRPAAALADFAPAGLVIEAIVEDLEAKRELFRAVEGIVAPACLLATNTSSLSITAIAAAVRSPARLVGMHFFNPAPLMELVEVIGGAATDPACRAAIHATAAAWGKTPVYARSTPGFIVNRVARPFYGEGLRLLAEQAAAPATLDALLRESGGFKMGPCELMDLIGLDVNFAVTRSVFDAFFGDPRYAPSLIQQELAAAGFLGRKAGRGFFAYGEGVPPPAPDTEPAAVSPGGAALAPADLNLANVSIKCGGAVIARTDGRTATQRAREESVPNLVLFDLALDYAQAKRVGLAAAAGCSPAAFQSAVGLFQSSGFAVSRLRDLPGLAVLRTVAMLANEAADVVHQGIATAADVDTAMRLGVNYPRGPLAWADALGIPALLAALAHIGAYYGEDRYRVSPLIRHLYWSGGRFHD